MGVVAIALFVTGVLTTTKVPVTLVSAMSMLSVCCCVEEGGEEPARSAVAVIRGDNNSFILWLGCLAGVLPCHLSVLRPV
jgi:hypothetical protein